VWYDTEDEQEEEGDDAEGAEGEEEEEGVWGGGVELEKGDMPQGILNENENGGSYARKTKSKQKKNSVSTQSCTPLAATPPSHSPDVGEGRQGGRGGGGGEEKIEVVGDEEGDVMEEEEAIVEVDSFIFASLLLICVP